MKTELWFPGALGRQAQLIWRHRYWLMGGVGLAFFVLLMFSPPSAEVSEQVRTSHRFGTSVVFFLLGVLLAGWFACLVRAAGTRSVVWFVALMFIPPLAFVYLFKFQ